MIFVLLIHTVLALSVAFSGTDSLWARLRWLEIHTLLLASGWGLTHSKHSLSVLPAWGNQPWGQGGKKPRQGRPSLPAESASQLDSNANGADVCCEADTCPWGTGRRSLNCFRSVSKQLSACAVWFSSFGKGSFSEMELFACWQAHMYYVVHNVHD